MCLILITDVQHLNQRKGAWSGCLSPVMQEILFHVYVFFVNVLTMPLFVDSVHIIIHSKPARAPTAAALQLSAT